eukprot:227210-Pelagomonas_calceolata.AAC.1
MWNARKRGLSLVWSKVRSPAWRLAATATAESSDGIRCKRVASLLSWARSALFCRLAAVATAVSSDVTGSSLSCGQFSDDRSRVARGIEVSGAHGNVGP